MAPAATAALAAAAAAEMVPRRYSKLYIHVIYACVGGESLKETRFFLSAHYEIMLRHPYRLIA